MLPKGKAGQTGGNSVSFDPPTWQTPVIVAVGQPGNPTSQKGGLYLCVRGNVTIISAGVGVSVSQLTASPGTITIAQDNTLNYSYLFLTL